MCVRMRGHDLIITYVEKRREPDQYLNTYIIPVLHSLTLYWVTKMMKNIHQVRPQIPYLPYDVK